MSREDVRRGTSHSPTPQDHIGVMAGSDIPSQATAGPYPAEIFIGVQTSDWQTLGFVLEVKWKDGRVLMENDVTSQWLLHIQPARDRHEQNVEAYRDVKRRVFLRFLRNIRRGEQLLVWYSDDFARQVGIPILTPDNIRGNQQYLCTKCKKTFQYPNTLKAHIRFRCPESRAEVIERLQTPMFSFRSVLDFSPSNEHKAPTSLPPMGAFLSGRSTTVNSTKTSLGNWLFLKASSQNLKCSETSAFKPHPRASDVVKNEPDSTLLPAETSFKDQGALNLSTRESARRTSPSTTCTTSVSGVSQPIQIFNHIHPPAFPIALDHTALRLYYPYFNSFHGSPRLCCGSLPTQSSLAERRDSCISPYDHHLLMTSSGSKLSSHGLGAQSFPGHVSTNMTSDSSPSKLAFPFPMPSDKEGEPLDLLPRSLFTSKSRKGHLCIYCGKLYSRKYGLKIHLRTHTGYKPLKCKVCLRPFGDPSNLNKHVRLHAEGETPYRCDFCGKVLVRRRDLERHIRSRHPQEAEKIQEKKTLEDNVDTTTDKTTETDGEIVVT